MSSVLSVGASVFSAMRLIYLILLWEGELGASSAYSMFTNLIIRIAINNHRVIKIPHCFSSYIFYLHFRGFMLF